MLRIFRLAALAAGTLIGAQAPAWPGWDSYQTIAWSAGASRDVRSWIDRLREIGFAGEQCTFGNDPAPFVSAGFGYYVENLVAELGFVNNRKAIYDADYQGYVSTRDTKYLLRKPSLHDEETWAAIEARVRSRVPIYARQGRSRLQPSGRAFHWQLRVADGLLLLSADAVRFSRVAQVRVRIAGSSECPVGNRLHDMG